ncbi:thioredoxin family protein [Thiobacillus sedimenti]|uniref:Thioredoxin family protein n=1 Tax=Thiobacillus sedimenti TaxID=3110231 RepID=A0ABZ1CP36_9PROT|nr:thioredoxin family protein [Thiobacillus sp. SCUT-2]WRS40077.1 thioredoxin family protein [Thiobacillus sp. SCUT-2]
MTGRREEKRDSTSDDRVAPTGFLRLAEGSFHARLAASDGIAVVLFSAPGCGACRAWKRLLPEALGDLASAFYEVDVSEATGVARAFGIFHLPAVYLYRDGAFHAELQCPARHDAIRETARALLAAPAQDEP